MPANAVAPFSGSKIALICDGSVLVLLRDDIPAIPYPNQWDLPGGGREGGETPQACAVREVEEEFGFAYCPQRIHWWREFAPASPNGLATWFMVGDLTHQDIENIRFGDEGQRWDLWPVSQFITAENAILHLRQRLEIYLSETVQSRLRSDIECPQSCHCHRTVSIRP